MPATFDPFRRAVDLNRDRSEEVRTALEGLWGDLLSRYVGTDDPVCQGVADGAFLALAALVHADSPV